MDDLTPLTPLQEYYIGAIQVALGMAGLVGVLVVFTCGFLLVRGLQS